MILYVRRKGMSTEILKEILAYIDEHIYEKISLLELAEMAGYSPFYFSKLFSEIIRKLPDNDVVIDGNGHN